MTKRGRPPELQQNELLAKFCAATKNPGNQALLADALRHVAITAPSMPNATIAALTAFLAHPETAPQIERDAPAWARGAVAALNLAQGVTHSVYPSSVHQVTQNLEVAKGNKPLPIWRVWKRNQTLVKAIFER